LLSSGQQHTHRYTSGAQPLDCPATSRGVKDYVPFIKNRLGRKRSQRKQIFHRKAGRMATFIDSSRASSNSGATRGALTSWSPIPPFSGAPSAIYSAAFRRKYFLLIRRLRVFGLYCGTQWGKEWYVKGAKEKGCNEIVMAVTYLRSSFSARSEILQRMTPLASLRRGQKITHEYGYNLREE
jgi:hypothetical protein